MAETPCPGEKGRGKGRTIDTLKWMKEEMANCCPSVSSEGWNHEPHDRCLGTPSREGRSAKWAAREDHPALTTSQTGACVVGVSLRALWALNSKTCKASDNNTSSTRLRVWFGSFCILNFIELYWAVTGDRAHLPAVCKHTSLQGFVFPLYCSKPGGHLSTHFILSMWIALLVTIRNSLFH